jgi:hypothetical protein
MKYELEMSYTFAQIVLFRPLLHYLQIVADGGTISLMQSQHALACIKLASTSILRSEVMIKKGLLHPGSWAAVYTVFSSVMCLIYLIAAHNGTSQPSQAWQRAALGIRLIAACKCIDNCAAAGLQVLKVRRMNYSPRTGLANTSRWLPVNFPTPSNSKLTELNLRWFAFAEATSNNRICIYSRKL